MTIEQLLRKWVGKTGAEERAEYQLFLAEFVQALGVPLPGDARWPSLQLERRLAPRTATGGRDRHPPGRLQRAVSGGHVRWLRPEYQKARSG